MCNNARRAVRTRERSKEAKMNVYQIDDDLAVITRFKVHNGLLDDLEAFARSIGDVIKFDTANEKFVYAVDDEIVIAVRYPVRTTVLISWIAAQRKELRKKRMKFHSFSSR